MRRWLPIIAAGFLWSCGGGGIQIPNCFKDGCPPGKECREPVPGTGIGLCFDVTSTATPIATPAGTSTPGPTSTPTLTPQATATPQATPTQPAATATPQATQTPCSASVQKVCLASGEVSDGSRDFVIDHNTLPMGLLSCWTCADIRDYMTRPGPGGAPGHWSQKEPGSPYYFNDPDNNPSRRQYYDPRTCEKVTRDGRVTAAIGHATGHFPYVGQRTVACPTPVPTATPAGPTPTPGPTATPGPGGIKCAPLSHIGVAFHTQVPAPNGPLGYRWVFSATNKAAKPFCPENRNECEQQGYEGDPVNDYDNVVWRFDARFACQQSSGSPLWNQQEPHTGTHWENTDVRQENEWLANLKPAVKGLHRVRTCTRDAPGPEFGEGGGNCRFAEKVAN